MRRSASLAISRARRRARSERPPSASAWMRQAILRKRNCLWFDRDCSPHTSRYVCWSWPTVILARSSICFFIAVATSFSFLKAVNLVSMRARCRRTIKWRLASALGAEPEVAGGKKAGRWIEDPRPEWARRITSVWNGPHNESPPRGRSAIEWLLERARGTLLLNIREEFENGKPRGTHLLNNCWGSPACWRARATGGEEGLTGAARATLRGPARRR